jgi:hypothetical protein
MVMIFFMWVVVRRMGGDIERIDLPPDLYLQIGDLLNDGSVVLDLDYSDDLEYGEEFEYPDDFDDDMEAMELY